MMLAIDAKFWGVVVMGGAVIILFFLPWLDNSAVKSIRYRPDWHKYLYAYFCDHLFGLGLLGYASHLQPLASVCRKSVLCSILASSC